MMSETRQNWMSFKSPRSSIVVSGNSTWYDVPAPVIVHQRNFSENKAAEKVDEEENHRLNEADEPQEALYQNNVEAKLNSLNKAAPNKQQEDACTIRESSNSSQNGRKRHSSSIELTAATTVKTDADGVPVITFSFYRTDEKSCSPEQDIDEVDGPAGDSSRVTQPAVDQLYDFPRNSRSEADLAEPSQRAESVAREAPEASQVYDVVAGANGSRQTETPSEASQSEKGFKGVRRRGSSKSLKWRRSLGKLEDLVRPGHSGSHSDTEDAAGSTRKRKLGKAWDRMRTWLSEERSKLGDVVARHARLQAVGARLGDVTEEAASIGACTGSYDLTRARVRQHDGSLPRVEEFGLARTVDAVDGSEQLPRTQLSKSMHLQKTASSDDILAEEAVREKPPATSFSLERLCSDEEEEEGEETGSRDRTLSKRDHRRFPSGGLIKKRMLGSIRGLIASTHLLHEPEENNKTISIESGTLLNELQIKKENLEHIKQQKTTKTKNVKKLKRKSNNQNQLSEATIKKRKTNVSSKVKKNIKTEDKNKSKITGNDGKDYKIEHSSKENTDKTKKGEKMNVQEEKNLDSNVLVHKEENIKENIEMPSIKVTNEMKHAIGSDNRTLEVVQSTVTLECKADEISDPKDEGLVESTAKVESKANGNSDTKESVHISTPVQELNKEQETKEDVYEKTENIEDEIREDKEQIRTEKIENVRKEDEKQKSKHEETKKRKSGKKNKKSHSSHNSSDTEKLTEENKQLKKTIKELKKKITQLENVIETREEGVDNIKKENEALKKRNIELQEKVISKLEEFDARKVNPFEIVTNSDVSVGFVTREGNSGPGGFEEVRRYVKQGGDFCKELAAILHERAELEANYAKGLSKLSGKLTKACAKDQGGNGSGGVSEAWRCVGEEMEAAAEAHRAWGGALSEQLAKPLRVGVAEVQGRTRKSIENSVDKASKSLQEWRTMAAKTKKQSFACARENERLQDIARLQSLSQSHQQHQQQQQSNNKLASNGHHQMTDKEATKLETRRRKAEESARRADTEFYTVTVRAERARLEYECTVRKAAKQMELLEEERLSALKDLANVYLAHLQALAPKLQQSADRLSQPIRSCSVAQDVEILKNLIRRIDSNDSSSTEQLLPDFYAEHVTLAMNRERRKQALVRVLHLIRQDLERERRGREGLETLHRAFIKTPAFAADESTQNVMDKLLHMRSMLTYLEAARYKVGGALSELEGGKRGKHPLAEHILVSRDKQGLQQSVLKVPSWAKNESFEIQDTSDGELEVLHLSKDSESEQRDWADRTAGDGNSENHPDEEDFSDFDEFSSNSEDNNNQDVDSADVSVAGKPEDGLERCRAIYQYSANLNDELSLNPGDLITVHEKQADGWWIGECRGRTGIFPATYVQVIN